MWMMYWVMIMFMMISIILMILCFLISKKTMMEREKLSPFECGFDPKSSSRTPFSSQFFLIAVLFLVFDIEIMIIIPMVLTIKLSILTNWFLTSMIFMIILLIGLYHEWKNGILEWTN
uniref:NADH-ubiquinone oxidoreductase chain 3 n=1 Tax=Helopeltis sp. TaxID=2931293 RepID=A0A8T9ZXY1_9HEMI|nr:NADH dehydrogenase subunit 3 [Helopeltis sp.]